MIYEVILIRCELLLSRKHCSWIWRLVNTGLPKDTVRSLIGISLESHPYFSTTEGISWMYKAPIIIDKGLVEHDFITVHILTGNILVTLRWTGKKRFDINKIRKSELNLIKVKLSKSSDILSAHTHGRIEAISLINEHYNTNYKLITKYLSLLKTFSIPPFLVDCGSFNRVVNPASHIVTHHRDMIGILHAGPVSGVVTETKKFKLGKPISPWNIILRREIMRSYSITVPVLRLSLNTNLEISKGKRQLQIWAPDIDYNILTGIIVNPVYINIKRVPFAISTLSGEISSDPIILPVKGDLDLEYLMGLKIIGVSILIETIHFLTYEMSNSHRIDKALRSGTFYKISIKRAKKVYKKIRDVFFETFGRKPLDVGTVIDMLINDGVIVKEGSEYRLRSAESLIGLLQSNKDVLDITFRHGRITHAERYASPYRMIINGIIHVLENNNQFEIIL